MVEMRFCERIPAYMIQLWAVMLVYKLIIDYEVKKSKA
jgi:hypothetical protein